MMGWNMDGPFRRVIMEWILGERGDMGFRMIDFISSRRG